VSVTAIVVNYNAGELLSECVDALLQGEALQRVLVIDNASSDPSARVLAAGLASDSKATVVFNKDNLGFARGVNQGIAAAGEDDVLVVNPDCILAPGAPDRLIQALGADDRAGLVAPLVLDASGRVERSAIRRLPRASSALATVTGLHRLQDRIPGLAGVSAVENGIPAIVAVAEAVSGACMLIRREALRSVGPFDEGFAMHCEDLDMMARMRDAGWHCLIVPDARAVHQQGRSSRSRPLWVHAHKHRGMARYYLKHEAPEHRWPLRWLVLGGIWLRCLVTAPLAVLRR
jgi:GT2 family glycosyltransferase